MKNVAYKVSKGSKSYPDGFVTDHFPTNNDQEEGFLITSVENFNLLLANNVTLMRNWEALNGIIVAENKSEEAEKPDPNKVAEKQSPESLARTQQLQNDNAKEAELFKQFLAWKAQQG